MTSQFQVRSDRMAESSGESREGGKRNVKLESDAETQIQIERYEGEEGDEESIEMRTARDAKAVQPSQGLGEPLEHHLNRDQLANLTLESRRIKVLHTNLITNLVPSA